MEGISFHRMCWLAALAVMWRKFLISLMYVTISFYSKKFCQRSKGVEGISFQRMCLLAALAVLWRRLLTIQFFSCLTELPNIKINGFLKGMFDSQIDHNTLNH